MRTVSKHSTQNGWHRAVVETVSQRTGTVCRYAVRWRSQSFLCHFGSDFLDISDDVYRRALGQVGTKIADVPVVDCDPHSDGGMTPITHQCGACGAVRQAKVAIDRLEDTPMSYSEHETLVIEQAVRAIQRRADERNPYRLFSPIGIARRSISQYRGMEIGPVLGDQLARRAVRTYNATATEPPAET